MNRSYAAMLLGLSFLLSGCGGGGGSSAPVGQVTEPPATPPSTPAVTGATGVWEGTFTDTGAPYPVIGLIYGGQLRVYSAQEGVLYEGPITVNGTDFTATLDVVDSVAGRYTTVTMTGQVVTGSSMNGTYTDNTPGGARNGTFSLTYDAVTERGASLTTTDANWFATDGAYSITLAIDATGDIAGTDTPDSCVYNGTLAVQDPAINVYGITVDISGCGIDGSYTGYATVTDTTTTDDTLLFVASTANMVIFGELNR